MSATCVLEWETLEGPEIGLYSPYSRIGVPLIEQHCRHCGSLIYSRRQTHCGYCEEELPASSVFTAEQRAIVSSVIDEERQRHREWLRRHDN